MAKGLTAIENKTRECGSASTLWLLIVLLGISGAVSLGAKRLYAADTAPHILDHSKTAFAVYRGDKVTVSVKAEGEGVEVKWLRNRVIICRDAQCTFDTSDWELGSQNLTFIVFNDKGSRFLRFHVQVLAPPEDYSPGRVQPDQVNDGADEDAPKAEDLRIYTMKGRGFSYHQGKLQVVGPTARVLDWRESLKTQTESYMRFGRQSSEMHILGPSSRVKLLTTPSGRRALKIVKGSLRSRNLSTEAPRWSILFGDFVQIDTDELGDVLLTSDDKGGLLTVLRGQARVFVRSADGSSGGKRDQALPGKVFAVPQGVAVRLPAGGGGLPPEFFIPKAEDVAELIVASTPEYFSTMGSLQIPTADSILKDKLPSDYPKARALAVEAAQARDYMVAIEALLPFLDKVKNSYEGNLTLGRAYKGLFVYEPAERFLLRASEIDHEDPDPFFELGEIAMAGLQWQKAIDRLEASDHRDYLDQQTLHYYLGVAHERLGEKVAARHSFVQSLWVQDDLDTASSAQAYRRALNERSWLDLRFAAGVISDSNIMRLGKGSEVTYPESIDATKSVGYQGSVGFSLYPWRSEKSAFGIIYDLGKTTWLNGSLKQLALIKQDLELSFSTSLGGAAGQPAWLDLNLAAGLGMIYLGDERSADRLTTRLGVGSPVLFNLEIFAENAKVLDPLPGRDDILDPTLWEVVMASDRSNNQRYVGVAIRPIDGEHYTLNLAYKTGTVIFTEDYAKTDSFKDKKLDLGLNYHPSMRNALLFDLGSLTRTFTDSDAARKDSEIDYGLGWRFFFTPTLHHILGVVQENHKSSREANAYQRRVLNYTLNLNF